METIKINWYKTKRVEDLNLPILDPRMLSQRVYEHPKGYILARVHEGKPCNTESEAIHSFYETEPKFIADRMPIAYEVLVKAYDSIQTWIDPQTNKFTAFCMVGYLYGKLDTTQKNWFDKSVWNYPKNT